MQEHDLGKHQSSFFEGTDLTSYPSLKEDTKVEIAIVGGGLTGISLAYLLKSLGRKVAVFEASYIGMGASMRATSKLTIQHGLIYNKLTQKSQEKAEQYAKANQRAVDFVKEIIKKENIKCDFHIAPSYVYTTKEEYIKDIEDEVRACKRLGLSMDYKTNVPINLPIKAAVEWEDTILFNPRKYLLNLAEYFVKVGGQIFEHTPIINLEHGEVSTLETRSGHKISADKVVIASHYPMYDGLGLYFTRLNMEREYVIALKVDKDKMPIGSFISVEHPIKSIRPIYEKDIVLIGGEPHRVGDEECEENHFEKLLSFGKEVFDSEEVVCHWSLQDYVTPDSMPYIGYLNNHKFHNLYVATGYNKWGMSGSVNAALILKDLILSGKSSYEDLFNPQRLAAYKGKTFVKHNVSGIRNYLQGKLRTVPKEVFPEKGKAVVTKLEDGGVYGIYQDEEENYHIVDILCPHIGARLRWNSAEKSWDCPFHGSRFSVDGEVLEGPSTHKLHAYKEGKNTVHPNLY